jgi:molybdopterin converting factor small subunit
VTIEVQLFATLAQYLPTSADRALLDVPDGTTVASVIRLLGIPAAMPRIVLVNGDEAGDEQPLAPRDVLSIFPPLAGGTN